MDFKYKATRIACYIGYIVSIKHLSESDSAMLNSVKANLVGQLENTTIVYPDGTKKKVTHK